MPLRHQAGEMRDLYANAIAEAVHEGREPPGWQVAAWAKYRTAAGASTAADALRTITESDPDQ